MKKHKEPGQKLNRLTKEPSFFVQVWEVARLIPYGRVTSYGAIARALGSARSARMVGWAMNAAHTMPEIPAHRVVNHNGLLTGKMHFSTPDQMQRLLESEGVEVVNNKVLQFKKLYWDPLELLREYQPNSPAPTKT